MSYDQTQGTWDFGFLPPNFNGDVQTFGSDNNAQSSFKWVKPRGVTMCYMVCIGGGGGGGGGLTRTSTNPGGGGGGGASSGIGKMLIPAILLPDVLLVQVGNGGVGKGSGVAGNAGVDSFIGYGSGLTALNTIPNIILSGNNAAPGGGAAGTTSGNAAGGTVPTIQTAANMGASVSWGIPSFIVGLVGATGGVATGGAGTQSSSGWLTICTMGGGGGAGVNAVNTAFIGGGINLNAKFDFADGTISPSSLIIAGGVAGSGPGTGPAGNGNAGIQLWKPFYMTGGSGGGSSDAGIGGNGGNGGIGCGGGGGGAGTTGGTGGNGGNGFVCIISW